MIEVLMMIVAPMPFLDFYIIINCQSIDVTYLLSEFMLAFMFLRIYFFVRTVVNYTIYNDPFSKRLLRAHGYDQNQFFFSLKCHLKVNPVMTMIIVATVTCTVPAYLVRIFEIPYFRTKEGEPIFDSFFNSVYFTIITL